MNYLTCKPIYMDLFDGHCHLFTHVLYIKSTKKMESYFALMEKILLYGIKQMPIMQKFYVTYRVHNYVRRIYRVVVQ